MLLSRLSININRNQHCLHIFQEKPTFKTLDTSLLSNEKRKNDNKLELKLA